MGLEGRPIITGLEDPSSIIDSDTSTSMKKKTPPPTRRGYAAFLDMDDDVNTLLCCGILYFDQQLTFFIRCY